MQGPRGYRSYSPLFKEFLVNAPLYLMELPLLFAKIHLNACFIHFFSASYVPEKHRQIYQWAKGV